MNSKKKRLSYSQIAMFLRCPRQYWYRYIQGIKTPASGEMVQSRVWHKTLEINYRQKIDSKVDLPLGEMLENFSNIFDESIKYEEIIFEKSSPVFLKDQGLQIVEMHHTHIAPNVHPMLVEKFFTVSLGEDFPYELTGVWDLVEEGGIIVDNKAQGRAKSQNDLDKDLQMTVYSLGYRALYGEIEKGIRIDAVIKNKNLKVTQLETSRTNEECRWLLGLIENVASAIQKEAFFPNPDGWHCSPVYCGYYQQCKKGN